MVTGISKAIHLRCGRHRIVIKVTLDSNGNSMAQTPQLASWKESELLSFSEELFSQTKLELRCKVLGCHQYFRSKNTLGCLEQVCVAPPITWSFVLLLLVSYFGYCFLQRAHSIYIEGLWAETLVSCHQSLDSVLFPCPQLMQGVGSFTQN